MYAIASRGAREAAQYLTPRTYHNNKSNTEN